MRPHDTVPGHGGRAFRFPSVLGLVLGALALLFSTGCMGSAPLPIPPLSPELVAARFGLGTVRAFAWSADGATLVAAGDVGRVYVLDARTRRFRSVIQNGSPIRGLQVVGQTVVVGSADGKVTRYPLDDSGIESALAVLEAGGPVSALAVGANGSLAAACTENGQLVLWDMKAKTATATRKDAHQGAARAVAFSADGKTVYSAGDDGLVRAFSATDLADVKTSAPQNTKLLSLVALADGRVATGGEDGGVRVLDGRSLSATVRYNDLHGPIYALAASGPRLAAGSNEQKLGVWKTDAEGPALLVQNEPGQNQHGNVYACAFGPDGATIAAAGDDRLILIHPLDSRSKEEPVAFGHPKALLSLAWSPDEKWIASVGSGPDILVWEASTASLARIIPVKGVLGDAQTVAWSRSGVIAMGAEDGGVCLVSPETGRVVRGEYPKEKDEVPQQVNEVAFSPDGQTLASAGWDNRIHLWKIGASALQHTGELKGHGNGVSGIAWSADGKFLASSSWDQTARYWDVAAMTQKGASIGGLGGPMFAVGLAPNATLLAGSYRGQTRAWNAASGEELFAKESQTDVVFRIVLTPDGRWVASGSADRTVWLYDLENKMTPQNPHIGDFRAPVRGLGWTRDASRIAIGTFDGNLFLLPSQLPGTSVPTPSPSPAGSGSPGAGPGTQSPGMASPAASPAAASPAAASPAAASPAASSPAAASPAAASPAAASPAAASPVAASPPAASPAAASPAAASPAAASPPAASPGPAASAAPH